MSAANGTTPLALELPAELVEQIAQRAAELGAERETAPEPWLDVKGAAAHLAISASQLYTLISQRKRNGLPAVHEGSRVYFKASALDAWRNNNTKGRT